MFKLTLTYIRYAPGRLEPRYRLAAPGPPFPLIKPKHANQSYQALMSNRGPRIFSCCTNRPYLLDCV